MGKQVAIIAGAGVAGLTAAMELLETTDVSPVIYEMSDVVGGISKTINYKENRMDIGGHRFFSKSDRIMGWWNKILPVEDDINTQMDDVMIIRSRVSRIFYMMKFFDYPIKLNVKTFKNLGLKKVIRMGFSYSKSMIFPIRTEKSLEDFFINRFGKELYLTFFRDYTEKVWGVPCSEIKPEWGAQRIKGISIKEVIKHAIKSKLIIHNKKHDMSQKEVETSLIGQFYYPKYGVGQMWDEVGQKVVEKGGIIHFNKKIIEVHYTDNKVNRVIVEDQFTKETEVLDCDYFISSMPVRELVTGMKLQVPEPVHQVAKDLKYRDFISVGLLLKRFDLGNNSGAEDYKVPDNWIYVQENSVKMGRIQIFNNWSPHMVKDPNNVWIGLEYFCNEGDQFWNMEKNDLIEFAIKELISIDAIERKDVIDSTIVYMPKAYPSYIGSYDDFEIVRDYLDGITNLFMIGRNGMHRYNNMDHSMLTALEAVKNIRNKIMTKDNIWAVNAEEEYHEEKKGVN